MKGLNRAYDVEETRPFWRQILVALELTLLLGIAAVVSFAVMVAGQVAATEFAMVLGLEATAAWLFCVLPLPITITALGIARYCQELWMRSRQAAAYSSSARWFDPSVATSLRSCS